MAEIGIRVQILFFLALAASVEFLVGHVGVMRLHVELPAFLEDFARGQPRAALLLANVLLLLAALVLVGLLPGLVRRRSAGTRRLDEAIVLGALALVGALAINALARRETAMAAANLLLGLLALLAALRIARGRTPVIERAPVVFLTAAAALPQLWRAAFVFSGGGGALADGIRMIATPAVALSWAATALLLYDLAARRRRIALAFGLAGGAGVLLLPEAARFLIGELTGIWPGSWPLPLLAGAVGVGLAGFTAGLLGPRRPALALGFLLLLCSGARHRTPAELLTQAVAFILLLAWSEDRTRRMTELGGLLF